MNVEFTYDAENQLTGISYKYDGLGRRIEKNVNGVITRYIYDNEDILFEYDGTNTVVAKCTHGPGIDEPLSMNRTGQTYYYHADGLGSIRQLSNSTGQVVESYSYSSFGLPTILDHSLLPTPHSLLGNPYTFTGRKFDPESGLYYYRARYYDPKIGRFLQEDPFRGFLYFPQSINLYPYVWNNPVILTDPEGEWLVPALWIGAGAAVVYIGYETYTGFKNWVEINKYKKRIKDLYYEQWIKENFEVAVVMDREYKRIFREEIPPSFKKVATSGVGTTMTGPLPSGSYPINLGEVVGGTVSNIIIYESAGTAKKED